MQSSNVTMSSNVTSSSVWAPASLPPCPLAARHNCDNITRENNNNNNNNNNPVYVSTLNATFNYTHCVTALPGSTRPSIVTVDYVGYVFVPLLFVIGIVGNGLTVRVMLTRGFRGLPVSLFLIALAVSDTSVNLLFPFNKPFIRALLGSDIRALSQGGCKLYFWAYRYAKTTSSWMIVCISLERFVAVWHHTRAKEINTVQHARICIIAIYALFAIYIGYWCSWADQILGNLCIPNTQPPGLELRAQVFLVLGLSFYAYIPAALILLLNLLIVYKLLAIRRRVAPSSLDGAAAVAPKANASQKTTNMLLGVAGAFVLLVTPNAISHIVAFAYKVNIFEVTDPGMAVFREVSQVMEQLNNSINFFLYVGCSKRFRDRLLLILGWDRFQNQPIELSKTNNTTQVTERARISGDTV